MKKNLLLNLFSISNKPLGKFSLPLACSLVLSLNAEAKTDKELKNFSSFNFNRVAAAMFANQAPVITSSASVSVPENTTAVTKVTASDQENNTLSFSLPSVSTSPDRAKFAINTTTGVLTFRAAPNFEAPGSAAGTNVYTVVVRVMDNGSPKASTDQTISVIVTNVNEFAPSVPTDVNPVANTVAENAAAGTLVGIKANATDQDGATTLNYSLINNANGRFVINPTTGEVSVAKGASLDFEASTSHIITVQASDGSFTSKQDFVIAVTNVKEAPVITSASAVSVPENTTAVITVTAKDPENGTLSYFVSNGPDRSKFNINVATGALAFVKAPDFEAPASAAGTNVYTVEVAVSNGDSAKVQTIAVTVTDVVEGPPSTPVDADGAINTVAENAAKGKLVGVTANAASPSGLPLTYSLTDDAQGRFAINASTGVVTVNNGALLNFEEVTSHVITVQASDGSLTSSESFTIAVTNVNEAPVITSASAVYVPENTTYVITITATDPENDAISFYLDGNSPDHSKFNMKYATGVLAFANYVPNFEAPGSKAGTNDYTVGVMVSDGSLWKEQTITVTVTDVEESVTIANSKKVAVANSDLAQTQQLVTYPNPAVDKVKLLLPVSGSYALEVRDLAGKLYITNKVNLVGNSNEAELDVQKLPAGTYLVTAKSVEKKFVTRIVKN